MGRLSTWASAASDLLLGERTERTAPTRPRPVLPTDLAERISQAILGFPPWWGKYGESPRECGDEMIYLHDMKIM